MYHFIVKRQSLCYPISARPIQLNGGPFTLPNTSKTSRGYY
jgi:hypothetical protein